MFESMLRSCKQLEDIPVNLRLVLKIRNPSFGINFCIQARAMMIKYNILLIEYNIDVIFKIVYYIILNYTYCRH